MSRNSVLVRVRQVASPRKMAKTRLERVQKINKVSKSLFGPVIKSEFRRWVELRVERNRIKFTFHDDRFRFSRPFPHLRHVLMTVLLILPFFSLSKTQTDSLSWKWPSINYKRQTSGALTSSRSRRLHMQIVNLNGSQRRWANYRNFIIISHIRRG